MDVQFYAILLNMSVSITIVKIQSYLTIGIPRAAPLVTPYALATTNLVSISIILSFQKCYINGII